jgi:arginyl-tRNA synthetase
MSLIHDLKHQFFLYVSKTFSLETLPHIEFSLNCDPDKQQFGDMVSNAAMILAKSLATNPRTLAQTIASGFTHPALQKIEVAGPGFLNFYFTHDAFKELAQDLFINKDSYFQLDEPHGIWNLEFVSANPTGPLHLGHGRGGIIGDVLGNIMRFLNFKITKEHYVNDAGSQMQKLGMNALLGVGDTDDGVKKMPMKITGIFTKNYLKASVFHSKFHLAPFEQFQAQKRGIEHSRLKHLINRPIVFPVLQWRYIINKMIKTWNI